MSRSQLICAAALAVLLGSTAHASKVDDSTMAGAWLMTVPRANDGIQQSMVFEVSGAELTGSVQTKAGSFPIKKGRIDGDGLSFVCDMQYNGVKSTHTFAAKRIDRRKMIVVETTEGDPAFVKAEYPAYKTEESFVIGYKRPAGAQQPSPAGSTPASSPTTPKN